MLREARNEVPPVRDGRHGEIEAQTIRFRFLLSVSPIDRAVVITPDTGAVRVFTRDHSLPELAKPTAERAILIRD